jgi:hypothetical protein
VRLKYKKGERRGKRVGGNRDRERERERERGNRNK